MKTIEIRKFTRDIKFANRKKVDFFDAFTVKNRQEQEENTSAENYAEHQINRGREKIQGWSSNALRNSIHKKGKAADHSRSVASFSYGIGTKVLLLV